ncbi:LPXTG cell wall anchor domain-containing protein [Streptococcus sinensis]|uniref:Clumping factor B n=1 Tax=Streptococcus sinensis TaxID=176090 RepID=A0A0A0DDX3_9STRE|nr:LPXTG cell wall anchor domain-containing protein [Streptococcus sinensis]KGM36856.1 Clumping factor B [Streptococcus sinensis]
MKKVAKYGITLLSVAVLAATTSAATVTADDVAGDNVSAVETVTPAKQTYSVGINHLDEHSRLAIVPPEEHENLPAGVYTYRPVEVPGYKYSGYYIVDGVDQRVYANEFVVDTNKLVEPDAGVSFFYEKFYPTPKPDPTPTPDLKPDPTPDPTPQLKPEPEPQPAPKPAPQPGDDNKGGQAKPDDNGKGDGKAENPADNQKPADKGTAKQPEGEKPADNSKAPDQSKKSETVKPKATEDKKEETKDKLPNTGEAVSSLGFLGVGLLSSLGLTKKRYKGRHERH